jgi:hypothetical protein
MQFDGVAISLSWCFKNVKYQGGLFVVISSREDLLYACHRGQTAANGPQVNGSEMLFRSHHQFSRTIATSLTHASLTLFDVSRVDESEVTNLQIAIPTEHQI